MTSVRKHSMIMAAAAAFTALTAQPAHAGFASWINDTFTFREDQRERVRPQRNLPPKYVVTPNFDEQAQREWSNYYTRDDLEAVPGLDSGASYVLRPVQSVAEERVFEEMARDVQRDMQRNEQEQINWHTQQGANPQAAQQVYVNHGWVYVVPTQPQGQMPQGYQAIQQRHQHNQVQQHVQQAAPTYIGEPNTTRPAPQPAAEVNKKTNISKPVRQWNEEPVSAFSARPGDYDYVPAQPRAVEPVPAPRLVPEGVEIMRAPDFPVRLQPSIAQPAIAPVQNDGMTAPLSEPVRIYSVQPGDSLSGIAQQPQIYNEMELWPLIYDANRTQIEDPDLIHPRQELDIPREHTAQDRANARGRAAAKQAPYRYTDGY